MTRPSAIAGLLVLDPAVARHAFYREALAGLADRIEFLTPSDDIATALGDSQQFAAVLIQLDGIDGSRLRQMGDMLGALAGTPVVFFSADAERVEAITDALAAPFDYLPWPVPPRLLRAKASLLLERRGCTASWRACPDPLPRSAQTWIGFRQRLRRKSGVRTD